MKKLMSEFKTFAVKGNVMDLAIGVIIGGAFSKIISSLVNDMVMPVIGMFLGGTDFQNLVIELPRYFNQSEVITLNLGLFINTVIEFLILAIVVFILVKLINRLKRKPDDKPAAPPAPSNEERLLAEIRDLLKDKKD